eukprot:PhM_4_TR10507/c4_g1_i2/m.106152
MGYFSATYCATTSLFFGDGVISSRAGVQQGDPLSPLFFSLALATRWQALREDATVKGLQLKLGAWYLDDGVVAAHESVIGPILAKIGTWGGEGFHLNPTKCEIISRNGAPSLPGAMQRIHPDNWDLLGTPLGTADHVEARVVWRGSHIAIDTSRPLGTREAHPRRQRDSAADLTQCMQSDAIKTCSDLINNLKRNIFETENWRQNDGLSYHDGDDDIVN